MEQSVYLFAGSGLAFVLSLLFGVINGFRNAPLVVATVISTRAISPGRAFLICAVAEFLGVMLFGSAVVATIGRKMFGNAFHEPHPDILMVLSCGIGASLVWGIFCHWRALPTSNNHALFAGVSGASWAAWGVGHLMNAMLLKVFLVLALAPLAGLVLSAGMTWLFRYAGEWMTPKVVGAADKIHVMGALLVSACDGSNNGQIVMSLILLSLGMMGQTPGFDGVINVPLWVKVVSAGAIALGVLMEGRRIVRKLGMSFYRLEIPQGVGSQLASAGLIMSCLGAGIPVSPAHIVTGSILGAGVAKNPRSVRWGAAGEVVLSWVLTIPATLILSFVGYKFIHLVGAL